MLVIDHDDRVLLCQYGDTDGIGRDWWVTPGGGKEHEESDLEAARRELEEELDRNDLEIGPVIGVRNCGTVVTGGRRMIQHERFFLCRCDHFEVPDHVIERGRAEGIRDIRWFSAKEILAERIDPGPRRLISLIEQISAGDLPDPDTELGW